MADTLFKNGRWPVESLEHLVPDREFPQHIVFRESPCKPIWKNVRRYKSCGCFTSWTQNLSWQRTSEKAKYYCTFHYGKEPCIWDAARIRENAKADVFHKQISLETSQKRLKKLLRDSSPERK